MPEGKGICGVRENKKGVLYTKNYGLISSIGIDAIEKKPLYHFKPGTEIYSIGSIGCSFTCSFCQNYRIAKERPEHMLVMKPEEVIEKVLEKRLSAIAFTYNEPTVWYEYMYDIAKLAKENNLSTVCVTNGFISLEPLKKLVDLIDAFNVDLKFFEENDYRRLCGGSLGPVLKSIEFIVGKSHLEVTNLVIEGENDQMKEINKLAKWLGELSPSIVLHLSRYFPTYKMTNPPTKIETLIEAKSTAKRHLKYVYIGNVPGLK
jgi:pyruvate formate lyase activating enzyme